MPNLGELIHHLEEPDKQVCRKFEKCLLKLTKLRLNVVFNTACIQENILPKYTNISLHDEAAKDEVFTKEFRMKLVKRQLENGKQQLQEIEEETKETRGKLDERIQDATVRARIIDQIERNAEMTHQKTQTTMLKKLQSIYGSTLLLPQQQQCYINLSNRELSSDEVEFLNMGLNCHVYSRFDTYKKKVELELLYSDLLNLEKNKVVDLDKNLKDQLRGESTKCRGNTNSNILTPKLRAAAQGLRNDESIVIRKADKSNMYVIMNRDEYKEKLDDILKDDTKFKHITRNTTEQLTKDVRKAIQDVNTQCKKRIFKEPTGDYEPGYLYGNVKTHKPGNKLRPIISQVTTPTYETAKQLDNIIKPYIPSKYMLKSRDEFINIIQTTKPENAPSSLDVESLFTNVPIQETIDIILRNVYNHPTLRAPDVPRQKLKELLLLCTTSVPFRNIDGQMFIQIDGMSMGSPLGPTFANYYMADLENHVLSLPGLKPNIYCRYVDDIYTDANFELLLKLKKTMEDHSVVKFTYELSQNNTLPFLDILTHYDTDRFASSVYVKPTDAGICLNGNSECPDRYKEAVIISYVKRAWTTCSSHEYFHAEISRVKQVLVNNSYTNTLIDNTIKHFMDKVTQSTQQQNNNNTTPTETVRLFYKNQMNSAYKVDEKVIKKIIRDNVKCKSENSKVQFVIYYTNMKTKNLVMKNNLSGKKRELSRTNVIYEFTCPENECFHHPILNNAYLGYTHCTLSKRTSFHLQKGAILTHYLDKHKRKIDRKTAEQCLKIRYQENHSDRLEILEALMILFEKPEINKQDTGRKRILTLFQ